MRRTMRTNPRQGTGPSYPPGSLLNAHISRPHSPFPHTSQGDCASTDRSAEALTSHSAATPSDVRFTSATAAVAAARVLNAHSGREKPLRRGRPSGEGKHFTSSKERSIADAGKEKGKRKPIPLSQTTYTTAPASTPVTPTTTTSAASRTFDRPSSIHLDSRGRTYVVSGEGVSLRTASPSRTPRVSEGVDRPAYRAEYDSAPPTPRGYEGENRYSEPLWSANRTEPLPRVTERGSRPVMRRVEKGEALAREKQEEGLKRGGSLSRIAKAFVSKKTPERTGSVDGGRSGTVQSNRSEGRSVLQRSGSLVDKALDFFAPDRHEVLAAGKGMGLKGRMRVKAGLPAETAPSKQNDDGEKKDSLDSDTDEPRDEEIWGYSREMGDRLQEMERQAEEARRRDEEFEARKRELERQRAMAMLIGEDDDRPGTSDSKMTTLTDFINHRDSEESVKPPEPLKIVKEYEMEPREIWNKINRAQGRETSESPESFTPTKHLPAPPEYPRPMEVVKVKSKEPAGMFGMSYFPMMEFSKAAGKLHLPWDERKEPRGFSCGSDLSFADCGAPDMMEECTKCGLVPIGAHTLRNGLCAKCTHPALRDKRQRAAAQIGDRSSEVTIWPRQSVLNRNTTYSGFTRNPFVDQRYLPPISPSSLGVLPEAEAVTPTVSSRPRAPTHTRSETSSYTATSSQYVPARANWRRASTSEDARIQSTRDTAFYGFYDDLLPSKGRESVAQNMRRRPSYF
ncbi:Hypothetical protein D9617_5g068280 [Elsinoe fawcettii]|nr:Hypothetical protein D9617_5g068280 [Elsinoe fawcettii]